MSDELEQFVDDAGSENDVQKENNGVLQDACLFKYGQQTYAVRASKVTGAIAWRNPMPLPRSDRRVRGVVQDRGQVVVLMAHPTGEAVSRDDTEVSRIIVCATERGYVGLPATLTLRVGQVRFAKEPKPGATVDSDAGALTYLDPSLYVVT